MRRRLYVLLALVCVLAAAVAGANGAAAAPAPSGAAPASAANPCSDVTIYSPTLVHLHASDNSHVLKSLPNDRGVTGNCTYVDNPYVGSDGHWFMRVALASGGVGYIWVQRLAFGAHHQCNKEGANPPVRPINNGCPLYKCDTKSCPNS